MTPEGIAALQQETLNALRKALQARAIALRGVSSDQFWADPELLRLSAAIQDFKKEQPA